jgi:hypothetical protein
MKSLRDEIRLAAGDMDGFNFIQANGLDFICNSRFRPCLGKDFMIRKEASLRECFFLVSVSKNLL